MVVVDQDVRFEALSAVLGAQVKAHDKVNYYMKTPTSVEDFVHATILGSGVLRRNRYNEIKKEFFVDLDEFFDPRYDFDFTNFKSEAPCTRGGESYRRPKGWYRMALKVKGKYPDGNAWLGPLGWRDDSAPEEWPVAYHGTSQDGAKGIIQSYYKAGRRELYGRGVYSTPYLDSAYGYSKEFTSKNGKRYRVIMQNRINPKKREQCVRQDYWLIPVAEYLSSKQEKEIVEGAIRPYGILIQEDTG